MVGIRRRDQMQQQQAAQAQNQQMQAAQADTYKRAMATASAPRLFGELAMRTMTMKKLQAAGLGVTLRVWPWCLRGGGGQV